MDGKPLGYKFKLINEACTRAVNKSLKPYGLTFSQISVLFFLDDNCSGRPVRLGEIENYFNLKHPTVVGIVERLESKGFVSTVTDSSDKRCTLVRTSEQTAEIREAIDRHRRYSDTILAQGLSSGERDILDAVLDRILANLAAAEQYLR